MGTTKSRKSRRNNSRPTAFTFLSNISLGNEQQQQPADRQVISSAIVSPVSLESTHAKSLESIHNDHDPTAPPHAIHSQGSSSSQTHTPMDPPPPLTQSYSSCWIAALYR